MSEILRSIEQRVCAFLRCKPPIKKSGRVAFWSFAAAVVLFLLRLLPGLGPHIGLLPWLALVVWIGSGLPSLFHWMRWRLLWRLRNRLFVTYLLIGLTPVVLFGILAAGAGYVLFGQFANFAATSEINTQLTELATNNEALALHFQQVLLSETNARNSRRVGLSAVLPAEANLIMGIPELQVGLYLDGRQQPLDLSPGHALTNVVTIPGWIHGSFRGLIVTQNDIYFRAITREWAGSHSVSVITSLPLDARFLSKVASGLGRVTLLSKVQIADQNIVSSRAADISGIDARAPTRQPSSSRRLLQTSRRRSSDLGTVAGGVLPKRASFFDIPINFPTTLETVEWTTGRKIDIVALVTSRPSLLYRRLFRQSLLIGGGIRVFLILTALVFAALELLAVYLASRLSRTITQSVSNLYHATREVDQGRLNYRIPVSRQDQLAALSRSFNTMSASLGRLLEEQKEKERLQNELAIAQEVQSNLFPACDVRLGELDLHGLCRPARTVSGDYYDFLVLGNGTLFLAIGDISGKGISAALLMAGLHSAVRAYRFASEEMFAAHPAGSILDGQGSTVSAEVFRSPGNLMRLLNLHLFRSTQQEKYATLFLAHYDAATRVLRYANGGQLPPLVLRPDGSCLRLDQGGTVVGLLDKMDYEEGAVTLEPGDLLVAYSDGVTEPENDFGDFGEARLVELVRSHRHLPLDEISARVLKAIEDWIGAEEQPDDITLVLARQN